MTELKLEPTGAALGAFVSGIDLREPLEASLRSELEQALATEQVLFFRDQPISARQHRDFGRAFGPLDCHPSYPHVDDLPEVTFLDNDEHSPSKINEWHTDMSFKPKPPRAGILIARIMPERGGDTLFSSLAAAYEDLPADFRNSLKGLSATHSYEWGFRDSLAEPGGRERLAQALAANPDTVHPLVRRHPISGRDYLFVNRIFTRRINELPAGESQELLDELCDHLTRERYVYRFQWQLNSIAFWDNNAVMHKPVNDYWPQRRRVERVTLA